MAIMVEVKKKRGIQVVGRLTLQWRFRSLEVTITMTKTDVIIEDRIGFAVRPYYITQVLKAS